MSLPPGILFVLGSLLVAESPRWLFRRGRKDAARAALLRSRSAEQAALEMEEMETTAASRSRPPPMPRSPSGSLLRRKYVIPFVLACVILFCNTATGVNSIIGYNTGILLQSGLSDVGAHWGYVIFTAVNFLMTIVGMTLVDRKGRKFLLILGTSGIMLSLLCAGLLFLQTEKEKVDCRAAIQSRVAPDQTLTLLFDEKEAAALSAAAPNAPSAIDSARASLVVIYSYGDFTGATTFVRSAERQPIRITRDGAVPSNRIEAFFKNPFADLAASQTAPLLINRALLAPVPDRRHGWLVALSLYAFIAFFALGPGVCVWLALSELMPTRIRSNGMSIALVINQIVSTTLAAIFLPVVSKYGYSTMFFMFAGFTVIYFATAAFFLPETKGKTLEEIEAYFERSRSTPVH